jgi:aminocarboxymuconate-semialdehyde decarboxylase
MEWALGAPFDDTIAAVRLIYGGVLDRFPGINWVVPHLGGVLPFLAKRLDFVWRLTPDVRKLLPTQPSDYLGRLWFDTANPDPRALRLACDVLGAERFMYASDFPFAQRQALQPGLAALGALDVGPSVRAGMKGQTARRLFGL